MKKTGIDREIVMLLVLTLATLVSWVGFEAYRAYTRRNVPEVLQSYMQPLEPRLDTQVLEKIEQKSP